MPHRTTLAHLCLAGSLVAGMGGCYKSQYQTEKTRATSLEKQLQDVRGQSEQMRSDLAAAQARIQQLEAQLSEIRAGGTLVAFVDGKPSVREQIRWDGAQWVRHGESVRPGGSVRFENGRLADQTLFMNHVPGGKPRYTGAVRFGKPDGDWLWFDESGKPMMRETWQAGRLVEVARASTAKGPLTWNRLNEKDRAAWVTRSAVALSDLPEISRDTTAPAATPTPATAAKPPAATPRKPAR